MAKRVNVADELLASRTEGVAILRGDVAPTRVWHPPTDVDVRAIRHSLGLSQSDFAARFGFSIGAVRDWEQGRRLPDPAARTLLLVIAHNPDAVTEALGQTERPAA
jgi:putative transcriptional regulator